MNAIPWYFPIYYGNFIECPYLMFWYSIRFKACPDSFQSKTCPDYFQSKPMLLYYVLIISSLTDALISYNVLNLPRICNNQQLYNNTLILSRGEEWGHYNNGSPGSSLFSQSDIYHICNNVIPLHFSDEESEYFHFSDTFVDSMYEKSAIPVFCCFF